MNYTCVIIIPAAGRRERDRMCSSFCFQKNRNGEEKEEKLVEWFALHEKEMKAATGGGGGGGSSSWHRDRGEKRLSCIIHF